MKNRDIGKRFYPKIRVPLQSKKREQRKISFISFWECSGDANVICVIFGRSKSFFVFISKIQIWEKSKKQKHLICKIYAIMINCYLVLRQRTCDIIVLRPQYRSFPRESVSLSWKDGNRIVPSPGCKPDVVANSLHRILSAGVAFFWKYEA